VRSVTVEWVAVMSCATHCQSFSKYRVIHNSLTHYKKSVHFNGARMVTCDIPIEIETLKVCLYMPRVLSYVGGRQGCRLSENGDASREGCSVLEYVRTQSIVTVQRRFRAKLGKDPPVKNSIK
jgi:hypothetical protein